MLSRMEEMSRLYALRIFITAECSPLRSVSGPCRKCSMKSVPMEKSSHFDSAFKHG